MPYSMLEPIRELLDAGVQSDRVGTDERWLIALREEMKEALVDIGSTLVETEISLRELRNLKAGDVIPIDLPSTLVVKAEDIPVFRAQFGVSQGMNAVKILEPIKRPSIMH